MNNINNFKSDFITSELNKELDISSEDLKDLNTMEELEDYIKEIIDKNDIIYYNNAIGYLKDNDSSLQYSLELADDLGYSLKELDSEILATLLYQNNLQNNFNNILEDYK